MKNGFFHERPDDYDIWVADHMVTEVGTDTINGHVTNARNEGFDLIADVDINGCTFVARRFNPHGGADHVWQIERIAQ